MKINKTIIALSVLAVALTSCGSSQKKEEAPITIKPATTAIKGELRDLFTVVDKEYTLSDEEFGRDKGVNVEIQRTDVALPFNKDEVGSTDDKGSKDVKYLAGFGIELLDSLDNVIEVIDATEYGSPSGESIKSAIASAAGETTSIKFHFDIKDTKPAKFRIISILRPNIPEEETTTEEAIVTEEEESSSDVSSDDLDKTIERTKEAMEVAGKAAKVSKELLDML